MLGRREDVEQLGTDMRLGSLLELRVRELSEESLVLAQVEQECDLVLRKLADRQVEHLRSTLELSTKVLI